MLKKSLLIMIIAFPLTLAQLRAQDSEDTKARPNKQEILNLMTSTGKMPAQQQSAKLDSIRQDSSGSKTPRSDFLFCVGLAYRGNYKAQRCVASDFEHGTGIVEDLSEAYAWYSVALENPRIDESSKAMLESDKERVKTRLLSAYPHPTEDDLDDMVNTQKSRIEQYNQDARKAK
jgi:hypothetical protein